MHFLLSSLTLLIATIIITTSANDCSPPRPIRNGSIHCTNSNKFRSVCRFSCDEGFHVKGMWRIRCGSRQYWNLPQPTCVANSMCLSPLRSPANGEVDCTNGNMDGSSCQFSCDSGYDLRGFPATSCRNGLWTTAAPVCKPIIRCGQLRRPDNGEMACDGDSEASMCFFECNTGYKLEGSSSTICLDEDNNSIGEWSAPSPLCTPEHVVRCASHREPANGGMFCESSSEGTWCFFECDAGYTMRGSSTSICTSGEWTTPAPTCARGCASSILTDMVIMLDTSLAENWYTTKTFVRNFITSCSTTCSLTRFGIFRYSDVVDTGSQILLGNFSNDKNGLLDAFDRIPDEVDPKSRSDESPRIGEAISYANNVMLDESNGDRRDVQNVVLLFTGKVSKDEITDEAQELRVKGCSTTIYVIPVETEEGSINKNIRQAIDIAGSVYNVLAAEYGLYGLEESLSRMLGESVCQNPFV